MAKGTRFENYFVVSALCGARPQEILGLKWSDVKLPKEAGVPGEATIRRRISIDGSGRWDVLEGTKTSRKNKPLGKGVVHRGGCPPCVSGRTWE